MSGDIAISQSAPRSAAGPISTAGTTATQGQDPVAVAVAAAASSKRPLVNPSLHLDLALNLVVLQFVDDKGDVTSQIPSEKQLKAYQTQEAASAPGGSASVIARGAKPNAPADGLAGAASPAFGVAASGATGPSAGSGSHSAARAVLGSSSVGVAEAGPSTLTPADLGPVSVAPAHLAGLTQTGD